MSLFASGRSLLAFSFVSSLALAFSACGGTSVQHVDDPEATGGTTSGAGQGATGGATSGSGGTNVGAGGTTGGTGIATGGTTGGRGTVPGSGGTTAGTAGSVAGTGASGSGGTGSLTCDDIVSETQAELARIQSCRADSECGQVLVGTSCGCTRDLVARLDADPQRFYELLDATVANERCNEYGSTCDCPKADGFACVMGRCIWNYVKDEPPPMCTPAAMGTMCIVGTPADAGDALLPGAPLTLTFQPSGCFSSSCTKTLSASCAVKPDLENFYVAADMCLTEVSDPSVGCTDDCGGGGQLTCESEYLLTEGTHTVRYAGGPSELSLTFTVPSVVSGSRQCATIAQLH